MSTPGKGGVLSSEAKKGQPETHATHYHIASRLTESISPKTWIDPVEALHALWETWGTFTARERKEGRPTMAMDMVLNTYVLPCTEVHPQAL